MLGGSSAKPNDLYYRKKRNFREKKRLALIDRILEHFKHLENCIKQWQTAPGFFRQESLYLVEQIHYKTDEYLNTYHRFYFKHEELIDISWVYFKIKQFGQADKDVEKYIKNVRRVWQNLKNSDIVEDFK